MLFQSTHKPNNENLPAPIAMIKDKSFYDRRARGLNVQFIGQDGKLDEWSFATIEKLEAFTSKLETQNREYAISQ